MRSFPPGVLDRFREEQCRRRGEEAARVAAAVAGFRVAPRLERGREPLPVSCWRCGSLLLQDLLDEVRCLACGESLAWLWGPAVRSLVSVADVSDPVVEREPGWRLWKIARRLVWAAAEAPWPLLAEDLAVLAGYPRGSRHTIGALRLLVREGELVECWQTYPGEVAYRLAEF